MSDDQHDCQASVGFRCFDHGGQAAFLILFDPFRSGLALVETSGLGGRKCVSSPCPLLRCCRELLLEWLMMMAALRNYSEKTRLLRPSVHRGTEGGETEQGCSGAASLNEIVLHLHDWQVWTGQLQVCPWPSGAKARTGSEEEQVVF